MPWLRLLAATLLISTACSRRVHLTFYHPASVTIIETHRAGVLETFRFEITERGKTYDCPAVMVMPQKDRITLLFVRKPASDVQEPATEITFANPGSLPVWTSDGTTTEMVNVRRQ
jgi:hypothetical protein